MLVHSVVHKSEFFVAIIAGQLEYSVMSQQIMFDEHKKELYLKIAYFTTLTGASILFGFSYSLGRVRKSTNDNPDAKIHAEAVTLARRALFRASMYSIGSMSLAAFATYHFVIKPTIERQREERKLLPAQESSDEIISKLLGK